MQSRRQFLLFAGTLSLALAGCAGSSSPAAAPTTAPAAPTSASAAAPTTAPASTGASATPKAAMAPTTAAAASGSSSSAVQILNVSYDPTRELYQEYNTVFAADWKTKSNQTVTVKQSHAGSGAQAQAVINGLEADVVTLAVQSDIDAIQKVGLIAANWSSRLGNNSTPYFSTINFLVRKGNPKGIKDWNDLVNPGVQIITPNPKTSGGARWIYLAAWGYELKQSNNDDAKAKEFVTQFYKNVPVLDTGSRGSTTTFTERNLGDVLVGWENEAYLALANLGASKYEIVTPSVSIRADPPVALVDKNVDKHNTRAVSQAYLEFLYTQQGQEVVAKHYYRPTLAAVATEYAQKFPNVPMFNIDEPFGGWAKAQPIHFSDGGTFDQIYQAHS